MYWKGMVIHVSFFAGEIDRAGNKSYQADLAHFRNPDVEKINAHGFGKTTSPIDG